MNYEYREISLTDLASCFPNIIKGELNKDFYLTNECAGSKLENLKYPSRFDCYLACYCASGNVKININLKEYELKEGSLLFYVPGNLMCFGKDANLDGLRFAVVAVSRQILQNAKVNFSHLHEEAMRVMKSPCTTLDKKERAICAGYFNLSKALIDSDSAFLKESLLDLCSSLSQYLGGVWAKNFESDNAKCRESDGMHSRVFFEKFMKLVSEHHNEQREVSFYAEQLNLTPKYLSQIIKKVSGKSAPDWIASFVILEAKNYLKYSDLDVKEISYKLRFSSTPVFFRYFKAHTGMTPLEYRRS